MSKSDVSPFELHRWEQEDARHFYFLRSAEYRHLSESRKHSFLIGHRGTGKTSLLRALNWRERISNPQLRKQLGETDPFEDRMVGCYFGLQYLGIDMFEGWTHSSLPLVQHQILGSYFRVLWLEEATKAVAEIAAIDAPLSASSEAKHLDNVQSDFFDWLPLKLDLPAGGRSSAHLSLRIIRDVAVSLKTELYSRASVRSISPERTIADFQLQSFAEITNRLFSAMSSMLPSSDAHSLSPWTFQMGMDEGEFLSETGRRSIRTLVRECRSPLLLVVASLEDLGSSTVSPDVHITFHDRNVFDLRERTHNEFVDLLNGIVNERFRVLSPNLPVFDVKELLGNYSLTQLLLSATTERPNSRELLDKWKRQYVPTGKDAEGDDNSPIRDFLSSLGVISSKSSRPAVVRRDDSAGYRKKFVAGYLRLLATLGVKEPVYAGNGIAIRMMENSLRDAFLFLDNCFVASTPAGGANRLSLVKRLERFVGGAPVKIGVQDAALKRLSRLKYDNIGEYVPEQAGTATGLLTYFAHLTHLLDFSADSDVVRSPEKTWFVLPRPGSKKSGFRSLSAAQQVSVSVLEAAISACKREGYLVERADASRPDLLKIRVNRSLAKLEGFSYRSPQYESSIGWEEFLEVVDQPSRLRVEELARKTKERIVGRGLSRRLQSSDSELDIRLPLFDIDEEQL